MCWIGLKEQKRIATEPVVMYKVLSSNLISLWYPHQYRLGYEECATIRRDFYSEIPKIYDVIELGEGIHGLSKDCDIERHYGFYTFAKVISYINKMYKLIEGVIPKGAIYYINEDGAMITERWIPIKIVPITELTNYVPRMV